MCLKFSTKTFGGKYYFYYLCIAKQLTATTMKAYKVIEIIRLLKADGWYLDYTKGDHRQF